MKRQAAEIKTGKPAAHGNGLRSFLHSNLFTALLIWLLTQAVVVISLFITYTQRTNRFEEWRGQVDTVLKRMDDQGTYYGHYQTEEIKADLARHEVRLKRTEDDTAHIDVLESEHRRLTKDVEDLKAKEKK